MFIVWGEYNREKERGVVADRCIHCGQVTRLDVKQFYKVSHVYFIPMGSGTLAATVLTCSECKGQMTAQVEAYSCVLPKESTGRMTAAQVLAATNPRLHEEVAHRANLERQVREVLNSGPRAPAVPGIEHGVVPRADMVMEQLPSRPASVPATPDPRVELAFTRLAELNYRDPDVIRLQSRLVQWHALDATGKAALLRDIDAVAEQQGQQDTAVRFVLAMAEQFKPDVDAGAAVMILILMAILGIVASFALFGDHGGGICVGFAVTITVGILASIWCHRTQRRYSHRLFFRSTFLPEAHYQDVSVGRVVAILQDPPLAVAHDPSVRKLADALPMLLDVLKEAKSDGDVSEAAAALAASYPKTRSFRKPINWLTPSIIVGIIILCAGGMYWAITSDQEKQRLEAERRDAFAAPFVARLAEYTPAFPQRDLQAPYRRGKVMPINLAGNKGIDSMLLELPPALRPDKPDDVGTIVWLQWNREVVGRYTDGVEACMITCHVTLIDKERGVILAEQDFVGGEPPRTRTNHGDPNTGASPSPQIINWVGTLPVKQDP